MSQSNARNIGMIGPSASVDGGVAAYDGTSGSLLKDIGFNYWNKQMGGRLTLESGVPVSISDQTAKTTLYYTPYIGNNVSLYNGSKWVRYSFSELSIAIPATTVTMYDVWLYDNSGTLTLELLAWTNDTTRATEHVLQDGVRVKTGDTSRRYLGSVRTTGTSGQCEDSVGVRFCWNYYNRVDRPISKSSSSSHTYNTNAFRYFNNDSANKIEYVVGVLEDSVHLTLGMTGANNSGAAVFQVGIGLSSTTDAPNMYGRNDIKVANVGSQSVAEYNATRHAEGYNYFSLLQNGGGSGGTTTWSLYESQGNIRG